MAGTNPAGPQPGRLAAGHDAPTRCLVQWLALESEQSEAEVWATLARIRARRHAAGTSSAPHLKLTGK